MPKTNAPKNIRCSFCGLPQDNVRKIIAGPGVYICDECINLCNGILENELLNDLEENQNSEENKAKIVSPKEINLYINSPGGSVTDGLAIVDTMNYIKCPVSTTCIGLAASFGAVLLANGEKGKRYATPNAEILIHQPLIGGHGITGQTTDIKIHAENMIRDVLKKVSRGLSRVEAGNPGFPRLVQVTSGGFSWWL